MKRDTIKQPKTSLNYEGFDCIYIDSIKRIKVRDTFYCGDNSTHTSQMQPSIIFYLGIEMKQIVWVFSTEEEVDRILMEILV